MNNNIIIGVVVVVVLLAGGYFLFSESRSDNGDEQGENNMSGEVIISVTDAAADMQNISEVEMTVDEVAVKGQGGSWTTVSSDSKTYNLLELNAQGKAELYAQENIDADNYTAVRVDIGDVVVTTTDGESHTTAKVTDSMEITGDVSVSGGETSVVEIDVQADESLHTSTEGDYVFAPVVQMESRSNAQVSIGNDSAVTVNSGSVVSSALVGTDVDGSTKANFKLDANTELEVNALGSVDASSSSETETNVDVDGALQN